MTTTPSNISMTAFRMSNMNGWQDRLVAALRTAGYGVVRRNMSCAVWDPQAVESERRMSVRYANGARIVRCGIGREHDGVAIIPQRLYFEGNSASPSARPERELLGDRRIAHPSPTYRISSCLRWAETLAGLIDGFDPHPAPVQRVRMKLHEATSMIFGDGARAKAGMKTSTLLMKHGFYSAPDCFQVELVAPLGKEDRSRFYQNQLAAAMERCHAHGNITLVSYAEFVHRLETADWKPSPGTVVLLGVTGKKGLPLSDDARKIIGLLTAAAIPFRMFSTDNSALNWSALDQIGSLLSGVGGMPYVVDLPWPANLEKPFLLGVDLGHPLASRISRVVISLLDHRGIHLESWRHVQRRDETIGESTLVTGLKWALDASRRHGGGLELSFLILRDGRLHKGEKVETYRRILGRRMTLVEFSKYDNPQMFVTGAKPLPAKAGTECLLENSDTPFITPLSPRLSNDLARTFKLNMKPEWDGLGLGVDKASELIIGLSYTPSLGLAHHALPGPIYWADGIAAIGETNHQFAGQSITT